jgi:orotidine-5'-phosphate decarboxylase
MSEARALDARARLAFALDYPTLDAARRGAEAVRAEVGVLKVGLELFVREGPAAVSLARELGCDVFLDLKLCDIPETVERAVGSASELGARYLTLHASGGKKMLERAARRAEGTGLTLLAVTVLTSLDARDLREIGIDAEPGAHALRLAELARDAGVRGLVCSAAEVGAIRSRLGSEFTLVTPGIRPAGGEASDQKRTGTPGEAIRAGSSLLVVGRPIRDAADPAVAARAIVSEIAEALGAGSQ